MSSVKDEFANNIGATDNFPGLRVLVIDDDSTYLTSIVTMLQSCNYQVTECKMAFEALSVLRERKDSFDIVICEVHMSELDGFQLLEIIGSEIGLPVVMMSRDNTKDVIIRAMRQGACDYLVKPLQNEELRMIWKHVYRKKLPNPTLLGDDYLVNKCEVEQNDTLVFETKEISENSELDKEHEEYIYDNVSKKKQKQRMVWTSTLHDQFKKVVDHLGEKDAVPKKILELMNIRGLTRENVASHLQKYRLHNRRKKNDNLQNKFRFQPIDRQYYPQSSFNQIQAYDMPNQMHSSSPISQIEFSDTNVLDDVSNSFAIEDYYNMPDSVNTHALGTMGMIQSDQGCSIQREGMNSYNFGRLSSMSIGDVNGNNTLGYFGGDFPCKGTSSKLSPLDLFNAEYTSSLSYQNRVHTEHFDQKNI